MSLKKSSISILFVMLLFIGLLPINPSLSLSLKANASQKKFDVAVRVIKEDGSNEVYYNYPYATFQGGEINERTAPSIPGLKFIRAYVRDIDKAQNVIIDRAEYREIGKTEKKKRVYFRMKDSIDDGVESSYAFIDTYPQNNAAPPLMKEGVIQKIFFEYYEIAKIYNIKYHTQYDTFVYGPEYVENKGDGNQKHQRF